MSFLFYVYSKKLTELVLKVNSPVKGSIRLPGSSGLGSGRLDTRFVCEVGFASKMIRIN